MSRRSTLRELAAGAAEAVGDVLRRVYEKAGEDNIFFMAGAIAFNVLVAFIPLVLAVLGIAGFILQKQQADPAAVLYDYLTGSLPPGAEDLAAYVRGIFEDIREQRAGLLSLATVIFIWIATRLIGTLRSALREIFDIQQDRGIIAGKIFDIKMVLAAGTLFAVNVGLTIVLELIAHRGLDVLGLREEQLLGASFYGRIVAFVTIWTMFLLIYRFLPARRIRWSTAAVAATFTSILYELLKQAFSWYVTNVADYGSTYGALSVVIVLVLYVYYVAIAFILGGEVAQVVAMRRIRRRQRERLG